MVIDARHRNDDDALTSIFAGRLRTTSGGLITLITMIAFEAMAVGPALPTAARELQGLSAFGWAFTAFLVANIVGMVLAGQLSDEHGPRLPLLAGMILFVSGLVIAGTAATMLQLVLSRAVQGLGGGLLITSAYVVIGETYPEQLRPKVFAATASAWLVPSLVGPAISGLLTQHASWRWVFLGLVPFVLGGCALLVPQLRTMPRRERARPEQSGAATDRWRIARAVVVAAGIVALEGAGQHPSTASIGIAVLGVVAVSWGLRSLLPTGTFRVRPGVGAPVALRGILAGAFFAAESVLPLMLSVQHGLGATAAGVPLTGAGVSWALASYMQGRPGSGNPAARQVRLLRLGFAFIAIAVALLAVAALPATSAWLAYPAWFVAGFGAGLAMPTTSVLLLKATTDADRGANSAALQLADTTTAAVTTGFAGVLVASAARGALGYTASFVVLDVAMASLAVLGALLSGRARTSTERPSQVLAS